MLGKLLKYEIKATARVFLPIYLVLIVFGIINRFMSFNSDSFSLPQGISLTLYIIILVGMFVASFIVMIQRFYKNLLSEEGYLMFTLPVKPWKHIISKLLVSAMWIVLSSVIAFVSIVIIALQEVTLTEVFTALGMLWNTVHSALGASFYHFIAQMVVGFIVCLASGVLIIYASIALGHLSNNHKTMASIGSFLAIYTAGQIVASLVFFKPLISYNGPFSSYSYQLEEIPHNLIWGAIALSAVFATIYFIITNIILSKRLNLE